jgi:beta-mannosidase
MDLSGLWRGAARTPELDRSGADPDLDDSDWDEVPVPGHWGATAAFADSSGPIMYRRRFRHDPPPLGRRAWLRLDGIISEADVWLDGQHLGDVGIYFSSHRFDITDQLRTVSGPPGGEHLLAVDVSCASGAGAKRSMSGSIQSSPLAPPGSSGGIWRGAGIETTGAVAIRRARLLCLEANRHEAVAQFRVVIDAATAGEIRIDTSIVGPDGSTAGGVAVHDVASGENHIEWTARIAKPHLWWPAALGDQPRYDVGIALRTADNALSDRRHWRTGLRTASVDELQWRVNGERLFVKGIAVGPHSRFLATVEASQLADDVRAVRDAGLNLIRVYGHVSRPELYEAADDLGLLVWQDLPLVGTYAAGTQAAARAVARAAVDELGHHPSIVTWCGHDEPNGPPLPAPGSGIEPLGRIGRRLGRHLLPSWNRSVLDPLVRRELRAADPSRSVITRSGNLPSPLDLTRSDSHLWLGWHVGRPEDLAELLRRWPRLGVFLGALGSQSVDVRDWPPDAPTWPTAEQGAFSRYVPRAAYADGESWAHATRAYQADVIRSQIETVRRLKYSPSGGFCVVSLFDAEPSGGFGVLDAERRPKPAFNALIDSCRPVVVIADPPPPIVTPNQELCLAVHAVSDLRHDLRTVRVTARARLHGWRSERQWEGPLPADSCTFIGNHEMRVPELTGALVIDLELQAGDEVATNRYQTVVIPPSEAFSPSTARPRS